MKHTWSAEYIERTRGVRGAKEWAREMAASLELRTGVRWSCQHTSGSLSFHPYMMPPPPGFQVDQECAGRITEWLRAVKASGLHGKTLLAVAEGTSIPLRTVCFTCWHLVNVERSLRADIDRMGKPTVVKLAR